jgi:hypothetical protein
MKTDHITVLLEIVLRVLSSAQRTKALVKLSHAAKKKSLL